MDLCNKYLHDYVNIYPPMNDYLLYKKYFKKKTILPNHYSKQYLKKDEDLFNKYNKLIKDKKNDLSKCEEILKYDLDFDKKVKFFESNDYLLDIEENLLFIYYDICINKLTPLVNKDDYNHVMNRLKTLSSITNDMIKILKKGIEKNIIINKLIINSFIKKAQSILDDEKISPKNVPNNIKKQFIEYIKKYIVNNIKKLYLFIINDYLKYCKDNLGLCLYKYGKKYYEEISKYNTLPNLTPDNIHDIGLRHLKNDLSLKSNLAKKIKVKDIDDHVYKNNKYYNNSDEIIKDLEKQRKMLYSKLNKYFYEDIDTLYDIKPIVEHNKNMTAYYTDLSKSTKDNGTFYINVFNPKKVSKYELLILSIHEGIPGHHYEGYLLFKSDKPDYIKNTLYSGYSEGWAFYCESLYDYNNDFEYYYSLQYRIERSLRLIIDTGIHYYGWNYDKCFDYMKKYLKYYSDEYIHDQILRYSSNPGQALTYLIGREVILHLKKDFMKKNNDIKAFHKIILDIGPCPLELFIKRFYENNLFF